MVFMCSLRNVILVSIIDPACIAAGFKVAGYFLWACQV